MITSTFTLTYSTKNATRYTVVIYLSCILIQLANFYCKIHNFSYISLWHWKGIFLFLLVFASFVLLYQTTQIYQWLKFLSFSLVLSLPYDASVLSLCRYWYDDLSEHVLICITVHCLNYLTGKDTKTNCNFTIKSLFYIIIFTLEELVAVITRYLFASVFAPTMALETNKLPWYCKESAVNNNGVFCFFSRVFCFLFNIWLKPFYTRYGSWLSCRNHCFDLFNQ